MITEITSTVEGYRWDNSCEEDETTMTFVLIWRRSAVQDAVDEIHGLQWLHATVMYHRRKLAAPVSIVGRSVASSLGVQRYCDMVW